MEKEIGVESIFAKQCLAMKEELRNIPKEERASYLSKVYEAEQLSGPPPFRFKKAYPQNSTFPYKGYQLNY